MSTRDILQAAAGLGGGSPLFNLSLYVTGENNFGTLGNGSSGRLLAPLQVGSGTDWQKVSSNIGTSTSYAIKTNGTLWAWGNNATGAVGDNSTIPRSSPVQIGSLSNWSQVYSGINHCLAVKTDGTLWSWGANTGGKLGLNDTQNRSSPVQIGSLSTWSQVAAATGFSVAIKTDGTLWAWGTNTGGQLGNNDRVNRSSPIQIGALSDWAKVDARGQQVFAIKTNNTLWAWGVLGSGLSGANVFSVTRSSPVQVGALSDWSEISLISSSSIAAVKTDGSLWTWGANGNGDLGLGNTVARSSPVQVGSLLTWSKVSGGLGCSAIKTDGTLWGWGSSLSGNGTAIVVSSPVQIGSLSDWSAIAYGDARAAVRTNNTLYTWGLNSGGTLGQNTGDSQNRSSPVQIGSNNEWSSFAFGGYSAAGVKNDGTLWTWGFVGAANNIFSASSPVQVGSLSNWAQVSMGGLFGSDNSGLALTQDNAIYAWGSNTSGNLGDNSRINRSSPVQVGNLSDWAQINVSAAGSSTYAIKTNGTLWAWGQNDYGQLGMNDRVNRSSPVQVGALSNWAQVTGGSLFFVAIKTDGTIWSCGYNFDGALGLGVTQDRSSPVQIGSLSDWAQVAAPRDHVLAVKTNGTLWAWGNNSEGQIGKGSPGSDSSPVQIGALSTWAQVWGGNNNSFAVKTDGTLWVWGANASGSLGTGDVLNRSSPVQVGSLTTWKNAPIYQGGSLSSGALEE